MLQRKRLTGKREQSVESKIWKAEQRQCRLIVWELGWPGEKRREEGRVGREWEEGDFNAEKYNVCARVQCAPWAWWTLINTQQTLNINLKNILDVTHTQYSCPIQMYRCICFHILMNIFFISRSPERCKYVFWSSCRKTQFSSHLYACLCLAALQE